MRCKKHITDISSTIGVCASCLRDRLFLIIAVQVQEDRRQRTGEDTVIDPPLQLPRSVSPSLSRRKSESSDGFKIQTWQIRQQEGSHGLNFFSTPHVGPSGKIVDGGVLKKKRAFGFRSKPEKTDLTNPDGRGKKNMGTGSRWWLVRMFFGRRRTNTSTTASLEEPTNGGERRTCRNVHKGMSPALDSDEDEGNWNYEPSGSLSEISKQWKDTPKSTPVWIAPGKRGGHNRNGSGFAFCLSPLVRASPSRQWNQKGIQQEIVVSGDMRVLPVKPSPSHPAAFCKNRSKKMADFGRCHLNR